jgi:site-specific recombinase XerD
MTALAPILEAFFTERLLTQLRASPHTIASYRDTFRLLLAFAQSETGKAPSALDLSDLDAPLIGRFLEHLEHERANQVRTRNARLAAVHSLYRFAALREPAHAALIQRVLAIPEKRSDRAVVSFLVKEEIEALLESPDRGSWIGRRDHALLSVAVQTGLRVSELTGLRCGDVALGPGAHVSCRGKGRKARSTPLTAGCAAVLKTWLDERNGCSEDPLFPSRRGGPLTRDAVERLVQRHARAASTKCPSLEKKRISPHTLRHSAAMELLRCGVDTSVIALWLGHVDVRSTAPYLHADMGIKQRALDRTTPQHLNPGRYRAPDTLLKFLDSL